MLFQVTTRPLIVRYSELVHHNTGQSWATLDGRTGTSSQGGGTGSIPLGLPIRHGGAEPWRHHPAGVGLPPDWCWTARCGFGVDARVVATELPGDMELTTSAGFLPSDVRALSAKRMATA
jgi:hypothetical protein